MTIPIEKVIEYTTLKEKTTAIIATGPAPINCLLWSIFSLLLRSTPHGLLEHFIVCINGPDKRTGDPEPQNKKQQFLEDLRKLKWHNKKLEKDMPITVIRAWSRVGHSEAVEMGVPWVHTDSYTIFHDDIILTDSGWEKEVKSKFYSDLDNNLIAFGSKELLFAHCDHTIACGLYMLRLPSMYSHFLVCNKKLTRKIGANFLSYNLGSMTNPIQFDIGDETGEQEKFFKYYEDQGLMNHPPQTQEMYNFVNMGFGSWMYYKGVQNKCNFIKLNPEMIVHFGGMSLSHDTGRADRIQAKYEYVEELEHEIAQHEDYWSLYKKYLEPL